MIAGKLLGIRNRIYTCRGFRFEHEKGFKRKLLVAMEKITASCAHQIVCISPSVRKFGIENGLFRAESTIVIHKGSSNGLNLKRFSPESINQEELNILKKDLGFDGKFIFGTVTRLIDRKGVKELYEAFTLLSKKYSNIKMLIVGRIEDDQLSDNSIIEKLKSDRAVTMVGSQLNIPLYLSLMDVFVLPAWWEGFGNVYVQAAAMGIPVIGTTAIGAIDAVKDGFNGFQVPPKTIEPLVEKMEMLYLNKDLREKFGRNGLIWAKNFDSKIIWDGMEVLYNKR
jgi:glycosyltransferase involved in cell wall biosynthesis